MTYRVYGWYNPKTGEYRDTDSWSSPPDDSGDWRRQYAVGVGRVEGGGASPGMPSTKLKGSDRA